MKKFLISVLIILSVSIPFAAGHPFTEETVPSLTSNSPAGTSTVVVYFSEPVDIDFSTLKVFDSNGNQVDNKDTSYHEGESSLIVTTSPLGDGIYTVSSKVLSKFDGHLVPDAFLFAVGDAKVDPTLLDQDIQSELIFLPEAGARFPGLVGQTIVLGALIASLTIWGMQNKQLIRRDLDSTEKLHHGRFMSLTGIGLVLVLISDILMITIQAVRLEVPVPDVIPTYFGIVWLARMVITIILLGMWFILDRHEILSKRAQMPMLVVALALIATTSLIGHGAASGEMSAIVLDYVHNLVAAVWIGGIFYFVFVLLPALSQLGEAYREKMSLLMVPKFSIAFVIAVGVIVITGPTLMWFLESNVGLITESVYGQLIILKITIAAVMIGLGGFLQFRVQKVAEASLLSDRIIVHKKLRRSLRMDAVLGIILLGIVALITNGTLPAGEIQRADAQETVYGFQTSEFTENARFDVEISPFSSGTNTILIRVSDSENMRLYDSDRLKVKVANPSKNISPIEVPMEIVKQDGEMPIEFQGELTFGFSGDWQLDIEAQRTEHSSESKIMQLHVKPRLANIQTQINEYNLPDDAKPLFPLYDGKDSIWISDTSSPRLWEFSLDTKVFTPYSFDGNGSRSLTQDNMDRIWFTDTVKNQIGFLDPESKQIVTRTIPNLDPVTSENAPISIQSDFDGNIWVTVVNKGKIVKYLPESDAFETVDLHDPQSLPFALTVDRDGHIWYSLAGSGKIGSINPEDNQLTQISGVELAAPEALIFDDDGNLWIAEHSGLAISKFDPVLGTLERIMVPDEGSLPFGMAFDRYGNMWFAQHLIDSIGVYDPDNGDLVEIPVPTERSFIQFMTSDGDDNVWFVEQNANKIGTVQITEVPVTVSQTRATGPEPKYTELASPLVALGIVAASLFYVKAVHDKRRLNSLICQ